MPIISAILVGLFRLVRAVLRLFPLTAPVRVGRKVGRFLARFFPRERRIARIQLEYVRAYLAGTPQGAKADEQLKDPNKLIAEVFAHTGEFVGELIILDKLLERDSAAPSGIRHVTCSGQEIVDELNAHGRGAVALSGHIGCFELLAAFHAARGSKISVIGRDPNYTSLSKLLRQVRGSYGVETLWRNESSTARKLLAALKTGRVVAVLIDQDTGVENAFSPFFGIPAAYPAGPIRLAIRNELTVISTFIVRTAELQHHVDTRRILYDPADPQAVEKILAAFNAHLEELILAHPEQWFWWHRRWRRRPGTDYAEHPGELPSTERYLSWISEKSAH